MRKELEIKSQGHAYHPSTQEAREEDSKLKANLGYTDPTSKRW